MRINPEDGDSLFQIHFEVINPVDRGPTGFRHTATFAKNWLEACDMVRRQFGDDHIDDIVVRDVFYYVQAARRDQRSTVSLYRRA